VLAELHSIDSLWVRLPHFEQYPIPATSFWGIVGALIAAIVSLVGSLSIAYFVYRLARHQFRSNRWWELQQRRYNAVANELLTIRDAAAKLALYDYPSDGDEDITITYTHQEKEEFRNQILEARAVIKKEIHRGLFLLSPRAIDVLRGYVRKAEEPFHEQYPDSHASGLVVNAYEEFTDIAQRDLGAPGLWLAHRKAGYEALRQRLDRLWFAWTPDIFKGNVQLQESWRRLRIREKELGRKLLKPPPSFATRAKKWLIQNLSIRD
jgi:hypothetical protein